MTSPAIYLRSKCLVLELLAMAAVRHRRLSVVVHSSVASLVVFVAFERPIAFAVASPLVVGPVPRQMLAAGQPSSERPMDSMVSCMAESPFRLNARSSHRLNQRVCGFSVNAMRMRYQIDNSNRWFGFAMNAFVPIMFRTRSYKQLFYVNNFHTFE